MSLVSIIVARTLCGQLTGGTTVKEISLDDMLPRFSAASVGGGRRKLGAGAMIAGVRDEGVSGEECGECGGA